MGENVFTNSFASRPELVAIAVLIAGFIVGRIASILVGRGLGALDRRVARVSTSDSSVFSPRLIGISRAAVFWLVLVLAIVYALRILGVGGVSTLANQVISFIPQALVSFAIIAAGHLLGLLASNLLTELNDDIQEDSFAPRLLYGGILTVAIVMGLQHIAIDISFVTRLLLILIAIVGGGLMLAFGLGARPYVENLLAHKEMGRFAVGERIRVNDDEGPIVEIHSTGVDIATNEGILTIPAARFADSTVLRIGEDSSDG